jgi:hypothetical protein
MQKNKIVTLIIMIIVAALIWWRGLSSVKRIPQKAGADSASAMVNLNRNFKKSAYANWGRNPFSGVTAPIKSYSAGLVLNGILWDKEKPLVMINDEILKVGDKISGNTVVAIKQDRVILNDGAKDFDLQY